MKYIVKIYKNGIFYNAYGDDGCIIHELLGYYFVDHKNGVGFPKSSLAKVENALIAKKISYEIYEKNNIIKAYKGIDKNYKEVLKEALPNIEMNKRLNRLKDKIDLCSNEKLEQILELLEDEFK